MGQKIENLSPIIKKSCYYDNSQIFRTGLRFGTILSHRVVQVRRAVGTPIVGVLVGLAVAPFLMFKKIGVLKIQIVSNNIFFKLRIVTGTF